MKPHLTIWVRLPKILTKLAFIILLGAAQGHADTIIAQYVKCPGEPKGDCALVYQNYSSGIDYEGQLMKITYAEVLWHSEARAQEKINFVRSHIGAEAQPVKGRVLHPESGRKILELAI